MALRAVFLDAGNTLVGLDYDTIARRIGLGLRLAVVSNSNGTVARLLEALDLARWLDAVVDSDVVGFEKPDPPYAG